MKCTANLCIPYIIFLKDVLLLCSDGLLEMTCPPLIEALLQDATLSSEQIVFLALQGRGLNNISAAVAQVSIIDISALVTTLLPPSQQPGTFLPSKYSLP
ncbi:hypothetical protein [Ktedonobacter sp. SOSP1-85]|uniref:hypothetical protein n=1 Tax=Ktedonobacter sp. SOSP1-85 TaxID=2778367 RepID=UPI001915B9D3|nr:hypothetical protein [Ktedonobacter sp. SOSP1-85]